MVRVRIVDGFPFLCLVGFFVARLRRRSSGWAISSRHRVVRA
jgi:hypothetical protein